MEKVEVEVDMELDRRVKEYIEEVVPDWKDPVTTRSRFKAFSGQRSDWEPQFGFWRDLILNIARRFNLLFLSPHSSWFNHSGLTPLCLHHVLLEMYYSGDLLRMDDLPDPKAGHLYHLFKKFSRFSTFSTLNHILNDRLILATTLQDKAAEAVKSLSENHWTASCIITMNKFETLFLDQHEAYAVLSYLSGHHKAKYISIKKKQQLIEGVKFSLSSTAVPNITNVDYDMLQLFWTVEELQQQLDVIDKQYERSRQLALAALRSGDRNIALRNARQLKIASESREKLVSFFNRVEGVLHAVLDAESTKKVSEAIKVGARAISEHKIEVQEVQSCLRELDDLMLSQAEVNKALESCTEDDEGVEEELHELELQIRDETLEVSSSLDTTRRAEMVEIRDETLEVSSSLDTTRRAEMVSTLTNSISSAMADLTLKDDTEDPLYPRFSNPKEPERLQE